MDVLEPSLNRLGHMIQEFLWVSHWSSRWWRLPVTLTAPPSPSLNPGFAICSSAPPWVAVRRITTTTLLLRLHPSKPRRSWATGLARGRPRRPSRKPHCDEPASDSPSWLPHDGTSHSFLGKRTVWWFIRSDPFCQSEVFCMAWGLCKYHSKPVTLKP